jgi:hypothetical protein
MSLGLCQTGLKALAAPAFEAHKHAGQRPNIIAGDSQR